MPSEIDQGKDNALSSGGFGSRHSSVPVLPAGALAAEAVTITDVTGRKIEVSAPVDRVILGEGRLIYAVAALDTERPFRRVVGWRDDLLKADPDSYAVYRQKYPFIDEIPTFGGLKDGTFDIEQAITLDPDVVIMNLEAKDATGDAGLDDKLSRAGIPLVYVDFREAPMKNTETSMRVIGKLFGLEDRVETFITFSQQQIARVTDRLAEARPPRPLVYLERAAGFSDECCNSFGSENFGRMVEMKPLGRRWKVSNVDAVLRLGSASCHANILPAERKGLDVSQRLGRPTFAHC